MMRFLTNTDTLSEEQGGFLPTLGTNNTISKFLAEVLDSNNNGYPTLSIFLDLQKAFETIDLAILLRK